MTELLPVGRRPLTAVSHLAAFIGMLFLGACLELSAPTDDVESLSSLLPAYPAVIAGDTLRDSLGVARRLEVVAFTGRGDTVAAPDGLLFILADTGTGARIENEFLIAGTKLGPVRVVAQVPGLQTVPSTIEVVPAPTRVRAEPAATGDTVTLPTRELGLETSVTSAGMQVRVLGEVDGAPSDVSGWVVHYVITRQPEPVAAGTPAAYLAGDGGRAIRGDSATAVDTTSNGVAARQVVLRPFLMKEVAGTVVVEARVSLHGVPVPGSPVIFKVPFAPAP